MKSRTLAWTIRMTLCATLAMPIWLGAQAHQEQRDRKEHHRYKFEDVGTFGGPVSYLTNDQTGTGSPSGILNRRGSIVSSADTLTPDPNFPNTCLLCPADPHIVHAFRWHGGILTDLGALPGVNSSVANWISDSGLVVGFSENGLIDPLLGAPEIQAVLWKGEEIINLGALEDSHQSAAFAVNERGQVVGNFLNTVSDPFSVFGLQVRAFLWQNGVLQDLGTLGGPEASANFVNERGQVAGTSFTNSTANPPIGFGPCASSTGLPTQDSFLWKDGRMIDLGSLGGTCTTANALNNRGQIVGDSNLAGDLTSHPFLWDGEKMIDLGTFGGSFGQANWVNEAGEVVGFAFNHGDQALLAFLWKDGFLTNLRTVGDDACSAALGINSRSQVVGVSAKTCSFTASDRRAFLWENGRVIDLNTFLPPGAGLQQLTDAYNINDRGAIAGLGVPAGCGDAFVCGHIFVLTPCDDEHQTSEGCEDAGEATAAASHNSLVPNQSPKTVIGIALTPPEIAARVDALFGRNRGFGRWPRK
jgi:probable HAF family extracellular repeat protein